MEVRTSDNVKMRIQGTLFWQVKEPGFVVDCFVFVCFMLSLFFFRSLLFFAFFVLVLVVISRSCWVLETVIFFSGWFMVLFAIELIFLFVCLILLKHPREPKQHPSPSNHQTII